MDPVWVTKAVVLAVHEEQLAEHGGLQGLKDEGLLDSALARPRQLLHYRPDTAIHELAAAYAFGLSRNHPFIDGNKRVSLIVAELFLALNGFELTSEDAATYFTWMRLAGEPNFSEQDLSDWLKHAIVPARPDDDEA